jgi:alpha-amylase
MATRRWFFQVSLAAVMAAALAGCSSQDSSSRSAVLTPTPTASPAQTTSAAEVRPVDEQPGTVYYEIFVRSFYDSNGDGIGDLNGVTAKPIICSSLVLAGFGSCRSTPRLAIMAMM